MNPILWVVVAVLGVAVVWLVMGRRPDPVRAGATVDAWGQPATAPPTPANRNDGLATSIGASVAAAFQLANSIFASTQPKN